MIHQTIQAFASFCLSVITAFSQSSFHFPKYHAPSAHANGQVTFDCGVISPNPIFTLNNFAPGDSASRICLVTNEDKQNSHAIAVKGLRTGPAGESTPHLEDVIDFTVQGTTELFTGNLQDFFADSQASNGVALLTLAPLESRPLTLTSTFRSDAGNAFQGKSVRFDLVFGVVDSTKLVINEVYFLEPKKHDQKNQWIEIYNPSNATISLKNWTLTDNNKSIKINSNHSLKAHELALVSKDASQWKNWPTLRNQKIFIETGDFFGLDKSDHLLLKNPQGELVDQLSWGDDHTVWNPAISLGPLGSSLSRKTKGLDTDQPADWISLATPTPGI